MGISPDVGGRQGLGKPLQLDYHELETTAQVEVTKEGLGMIPNTLDIPFTQLGGNIWKYQAPSTNPEMAPLNLSSGLSYPDAELFSEMEFLKFKELAKELPLKLGTELSKQSRKPPEDRDPEFLVLERILKFTAKALVWLEMVSEIDFVPFAEISHANSRYPEKIFQNWVNEIKAWINELESLVLQFPENLALQRTLRTNINILTPLYQEGKEVVNRSLHDQPREMLSLINSALALQKINQQKRVSNSLGVLDSLLEALISFGAAFSGSTSTPMLLSLLLSTRGLKVTHEDGVFGKIYEELLENVIKAIPAVSAPQYLATVSIIKAVCLIFITLLCEAGGLVSTGSRDRSRTSIKQGEESIHSLSCRLASCLLTSCGFLPAILQRMLRYSISDEEISSLITPLGTLIAINTLLLASNGGNKYLKAVSSLVRGMQKEIHQQVELLKSAEEMITAPHLLRALRQADLALKNGNIGAYLESIKVALQTLQFNWESLQKECINVFTFVLVILPTCYSLEKQGRFASVINQAA